MPNYPQNKWWFSVAEIIMCMPFSVCFSSFTLLNFDAVVTLYQEQQQDAEAVVFPENMLLYMIRMAIIGGIFTGEENKDSPFLLGNSQSFIS